MQLLQKSRIQPCFWVEWGPIPTVAESYSCSYQSWHSQNKICETIRQQFCYFTQVLPTFDQSFTGYEEKQLRPYVVALLSSIDRPHASIYLVSKLSNSPAPSVWQWLQAESMDLE